MARADCQWEVFRTLGHHAKQEAIRECAPDEQVDLYLRWSNATIPPNTDLVDTLAAQGPDVVPAVVARMERTKRPEDQIAKPDLIFVLVRMQDLGQYEVAKDEKLMTRLGHAVATMTEPELRKAAEETLGWLKKPRS